MSEFMVCGQYLLEIDNLHLTSRVQTHPAADQGYVDFVLHADGATYARSGSEMTGRGVFDPDRTAFVFGDHHWVTVEKQESGLYRLSHYTQADGCTHFEDFPESEILAQMASNTHPYYWDHETWLAVTE